MEKYPKLRSDPFIKVLEVLPDDVLELIISNIYIMVEGKVESFIK